MNANGFITSLDRVAIWITRMALLNLYWIFFCLRGLVVGGVFPATVGSLSVVRKWLKGERDINIGEVMKENYKKEFLSSNILGWIMSSVGFVLYMNYQVLKTSNDVHFIFPFFFFITVFFYFLVLIWSFPLMAHYHGGVIQHVKNALVIGLTKIHISSAICITLFSVMYLSLEYPTIILFFFFSISSLIWFWLASTVFHKMDRKTVRAA
ncbi:YesL family protein [Radiobacillus deserti]|uniref:DUF624 domain-containing protein n=1 Tax=Radiobacillus deserti TaxID=2594883 RepID=A0A516KCH3_9BACI|nr:DUF624 domain-containing protein [Radiobacillus deserti]QDP39104.1 DUF624 domain-containing protein [Radiobacillus deserti]